MPVFLSYAKSFQYAVNTTDDVQQEFVRFYATVRDLFDRFYPARTIVITSGDPEFVTPAVKAMLRRKNSLMRRGRIDEADVLACRIGRAIIRYNSVELYRVDPKIRVQCGLKLGNSLAAAAPTELRQVGLIQPSRPII